MSCRQLTPNVIDFARGIALDRSREAAVLEHIRSCVPCAALVERERAMSAMLRRVADEERVPEQNDVRLGRLLAIFDAPRPRAGRVKIALEWSLAASVLIVAGLAVGWKGGMPATHGHLAATPAPPANAENAFVVLPGASALPRFESGQVIRMELPSADGAIQADVLFGQDGLARAVRFVQ